MARTAVSPAGKRALRVILVTAVALRWLHLLIISRTDLARLPIIDAAFYHNWAIAVSQGRPFWGGIFFMSPLYPYLTGLIYALFGAEPWRMMLMQGLLTAGTIALAFRWAARLFGNPSALITAAILALYAPSIFFDGTLLTTSLIFFLSALILNFAQDAFKRGSRADLLKLGAAVGGSALARPLALMFLPLLFIGFYINDRRSSLKKWGLTLAATLVILAPVAVRNLVVGGEFVLTTSSAGMNFYVGNNPSATGLYWEAPFLSSVEPGFENEEYRLEASRRAERELTTREAGGYWMRQALDWMLHDPGAWLKLTARKAFYFFSRAEFANNVSIYIGQDLSPLVKFNPFGYWLLAPLGLAGLILGIVRHGWRRVQVGWLFTAAYFVGALLFFVSSEYRFPVVLPLAAGAGYLATEIAAEFRARRLEAALKLVALALLFMPLVNLRSDFIRRGENSRMDWFNFGNTHLKFGRYDAAISALNRALAIDPYFVEALHSLADAYYRSGQSEKVMELGRRVGLERPEDMLKIVRGGALREAFALVGEGRFQEAMTEFAYAGWDEGKAAAETTRMSRLLEARLAYESGRPELTLELFRKVWEADSAIDPSVAYNLGILHFQAGRIDSAEFYAAQGLLADSLNTPCIQLLARVYQRTDRMEEATQLLSRINSDAETHEALLMRVRAQMDSLEARGEAAAALEAYRAYGRFGYEIAPEDRLRIGRLQIQVGNYDLALRLLDEAEIAGVESAGLHIARGKALLAMGRGQEAAASFAEAARIQPDNISARIELARLKLKWGDADGALKELEAVAHLDIIDPQTALEYQGLMDSVKAGL